MIRPHVSTGKTSTAGTPARNALGPIPTGGMDRRRQEAVARARADGTSNERSGTLWSTSRMPARTNESGNESGARRESPIQYALPDVTIDLSVQRLTGLLVDGDGEDASAARARRHRVGSERVTRNWYGPLHTRKH